VKTVADRHVVKKDKLAAGIKPTNNGFKIAALRF